MENTGSTGSLVTLVTEGGLDSRSFVFYTNIIGLASRRVKEEGGMAKFKAGDAVCFMDRVGPDVTGEVECVLEGEGVDGEACYVINAVFQNPQQVSRTERELVLAPTGKAFSFAYADGRGVSVNMFATRAARDAAVRVLLEGDFEEGERPFAEDATAEEAWAAFCNADTPDFFLAFGELEA